MWICEWILVCVCVYFGLSFSPVVAFEQAIGMKESAVMCTDLYQLPPFLPNLRGKGW